MKVTIKVELLKQLEDQIKMLQTQLSSLKYQTEGFEILDSDLCLLEVYNG